MGQENLERRKPNSKASNRRGSSEATFDQSKNQKRKEASRENVGQRWKRGHFFKSRSFENEYLVKTWRPGGPYDEESEKAIEEAEDSYSAEGYKDPLEWMIARFGKEKGKQLYYTAQAYGCICADWLCRDCIALDEDEYFERIHQCWTAQLKLPG